MDADFFKPTSSTGSFSVHRVIKEQVNKWHDVFMGIATTFYLGGLVLIGIKIILSESVLSKANTKDLAVRWLTGVLILFMFNTIMKYAFQINESLVRSLGRQFYTRRYATGTYIGDADEYSRAGFEFRSPEYRSKYTGILSFGGEEINNAYIKRLEDYKSSADLMRIMRAYAGASHRIIFCIIWFILLFQLLILLVKYYKRFFVLALLITIFPFVAIYYFIDAVKGKQCELLRTWCVEFFVNVFIQSIHAIIYCIIASVCIEQVTKELQAGSERMNWLLVICAIDFLFRGEKIVRKLLGADGSASMRTASESAQAGKKGLRQGRAHLTNIAGMFKGGKK